MDRNAKVFLSTILTVLMMLSVASLVPAVDSGVDEAEEPAEVRTVHLENSFTEYIESVQRDIIDGSVYNQDDGTLTVTDAGSIVGYDDSSSPISFTVDRDGVFSDCSDGFIEAMGCVDDYSVIYDDTGGISDIQVTVDGDELYLKDYYSPVDDCFFFVIPAAYYGYLAAAALVAVVGACLIDQSGNTNSGGNNSGGSSQNTSTIDYYEGVVDGIKVGKDSSGRILSVSVNGTEHQLTNEYAKNRPTDGVYHFALKYNSVVYVFPEEISKSVAESVMKLKVNKDGKFSVYSYHKADARIVASVLGEPYEDGNCSDDYTYMEHYHTTSHQTNAHAFYIVE